MPRLRIYWKIFLKTLVFFFNDISKRMNDSWKPIEIREVNSSEKL